MKLLPCPRCYSDNVVIVGYGHDHFVRCDDCGIENSRAYGGQPGYPDRKDHVFPHAPVGAHDSYEAAKDWNHRGPMKPINV